MLRGIIVALLALPASAALADGHSVGIKVGALGLGAEYTYALTERIALRGGLYGSQVGFDAEESDIEYEFDIVWDSFSAGIDFHPLKSPLRLSLAFMQNDNRLELLSRPTQSVEVGNRTYTPSQVGTLTGGAGFDDTATMVGIGWDWSRNKSVFGMSLDVGVVDQGSPVVTLRGNGTLLGDPIFEQDIAAEARQLTAEIEDLDLAPFVSVGFQFRF